MPEEEKPSKSKLVNFYKLKKVQKHMPQFKDEQKQYTGIPLQQHILATGKTGSGKSQALLNYILETSKAPKGTFFKIFLVYKTYEPLYKYLEDEIEKDKFQLCEGIDALPDIKTFADSSETNKKQYLIIFDDCVNDKDTKSLKKIQPYYTFGRKKGITNFFLTQSFFQTDIFIRKQTSWLLLCGISGNQDLKSILRNYAIGDINVETMMKMYEYAKTKEDDDDVTFLKLCCYECPATKKFSKNWLEYLNPKEFYVSDKKGKTSSAGTTSMMKSKKVNDSSDSESNSSSEDENDSDNESEAESHPILTLQDILSKR